jgi:hypothetical protein
LTSAQASSKPYRYKRATFGGKGLAEDGSWEKVRDRIYEGRGA